MDLFQREPTQQLTHPLRVLARNVSPNPFEMHPTQIGRQIQSLNEGWPARRLKIDVPRLNLPDEPGTPVGIDVPSGLVERQNKSVTSEACSKIADHINSLRWL